MKKIRFKKLEPTGTFAKLFGLHRDKQDPDVAPEETDDVYEYYYKRGNTCYFRNSAGDKRTIEYNETHKELVRGNKYNIDAISNAND
ncbi:MAG TPA: hypothetical protein VM010_03680 [Chitinophagaceae bacterium]|nr:hypothetical protein [Chitinophagaceae bacterium]